MYQNRKLGWGLGSRGRRGKEACLGERAYGEEEGRSAGGAAGMAGKVRIGGEEIIGRGKGRIQPPEMGGDRVSCVCAGASVHSAQPKNKNSKRNAKMQQETKQRKYNSRVG